MRVGLLHPQAFKDYKRVLDISAKACDAELALRVDHLIQKASVTKVEGVLVRAFEAISDSSKLRSKVQSEMVALRSVVGKAQEKKVLTPLLQAKTRDALAFKRTS